MELFDFCFNVWWLLSENEHTIQGNNTIVIGRTDIIILANNQLDALFHVFIYFISLHVSSVTVLIIRRSNCINTSSGMISLCDCMVCRSGIPSSRTD